MRNPKFKIIKPNYKKNILEITLTEGKKTKRYNLPFAVFRELKIGKNNPFVSMEIEKELDCRAVNFELKDGNKGDFAADLVLYYCEPSYSWGPINQLKKSLKEKIKSSKLSLRVLADALKTSPAQVVRLLDEHKASKQLIQLFQMAGLVGCRIEIEEKEAA
jgi:hypothetical protein